MHSICKDRIGTQPTRKLGVNEKKPGDAAQLEQWSAHCMSKVNLCQLKAGNRDREAARRILSKAKFVGRLVLQTPV